MAQQRVRQEQATAVAAYGEVAMHAAIRPQIRVVRMDTPPRGKLIEDAREVLIRSCPGKHTVTGSLVAFADAVELHLSVDGHLRRVLRFLTDSSARKYLERLTRRLEARGYQS